MKKPLVVVAALSVFVVLALGMSSILAAPPVGKPLPPPPVLCGCICPDGSFITTHARKAKACPRACAAACDSGSATF